MLGACVLTCAPARAPWGEHGPQELPYHRTSPHADGRRGDFLLETPTRTGLVIGSTPHRQGHRPLEGAIVDLVLDGNDAADPLEWWRAGWQDARGLLHVGPAASIAPTACANNAPGVLVTSRIDQVELSTRICAEQAAFRITTTGSLPAGAHLADELNGGASDVLIDSVGNAWEGARATRFVAVGGHGMGLTVSARDMMAERRMIRISSESFPAPLVLRYGRDRVERTLHITHGDVFDALAPLPYATRKVIVPMAQRGTFDLLGPKGEVLARGVSHGQRTLVLPPDLGSAIRFRDEDGVPAAKPYGLGELANHVELQSRARGRLALQYVDGSGQPLPVHVLLRGLEGTPDPEPTSGPDTFAAGRSLYLLRGKAQVRLATGVYRVTANHGISHSLSERVVTITSSGEVRIADALRDVVHLGPDWASADFHLHAAPSPDSNVSLEERVASLVCAGVDFAVATDHNRLTDYAPAVKTLGLERRLTTVVGDEITSAGPSLWGHFNAFPLTRDAIDPKNHLPAYFDTPPEEVFRRARSEGARFVQVNHARMPPKIGYFDLTHLDPKTGEADAAFSAHFDALEAFNGFWLETPERVREGALDLVALARRGMRPIATGNSDSHRLLFEEAGYPRTLLHLGPGKTREARVFDALARGNTRITSGPWVDLEVEGQEPGGIVRPKAGVVTARIRVKAPAWISVDHVELWRDDSVVQQFDEVGPAQDGDRFDRTVTLAVDHDAVLLAWAEGKTPLPDVVPYPRANPIGFTGLVYVDADGDGIVRPKPARPAPAAP